MLMKQKRTRREFVQSATAGSLYAAYVLTTGCALRHDFDLLVINGELCDGSGAATFQADVGIANGKIAAIGALQKHTAARMINAKNKIVAPGFIDIHSHSDTNLLVDGRAMSKILQGVTTEVVGQDGSSVAPVKDEWREQRNARLQKRYGLSVDWTDFKGYFEQICKQGSSVNLMGMIGAGTLRAYTIGEDDRPATAEEMQEMQDLIRVCQTQGARHLSSGLEYTPGSFASTEELAQLASVLGAGGIYSSHIRNEDDRLEEAISEAITIAKNGNCGVNISHLKAQGQRNWHKLSSVFAALEQARKNGMRATCDRYPYIAYSTGLANLFPIWAQEGGSEKFVARLQAPENQQSIRSYVLDKVSALGSWNSVLISSLSGDENKNYVGRRFGELAQELQREPYDLLLEIMVSQNGGGMVGFGMSEENTKRILAHPYVAIASDGSARTVKGALASGSPHPRNYGTFPRVLGYYVREQKTLTLPEAIRKMTSLPASIVGIHDRGKLTQDYWADVTVFDPDTVVDRATFAEPKQYPQGIDHVIVNGKIVVHNGEHTGAKPGVVI